MIVLDTHVAVWWTQDPDRLSGGAEEAINGAAQIVIPAIVFWEVSLLVRKERLQLRGAREPNRWTEEVLRIPRVVEARLSAHTAVAADSLNMHPDPADRFIVATALDLGMPLVTKDELLRSLVWLRTIW